MDVTVNVVSITCPGRRMPKSIVGGSMAISGCIVEPSTRNTTDRLSPFVVTIRKIAVRKPTAIGLHRRMICRPSPDKSVRGTLKIEINVNSLGTEIIVMILISPISIVVSASLVIITELCRCSPIFILPKSIVSLEEISAKECFGKKPKLNKITTYNSLLVISETGWWPIDIVELMNLTL